jgi:hypothetical protein
VLGVISSVFLDNEYAQNSISVLLYAYAQGSKQMLRGVDFGDHAAVHMRARCRPFPSRRVHYLPLS